MIIFKNKIPKRVLKTVPRHVGIVCDGNGRWGIKHGLLRTAGHQLGMKRVKEIATACAEAGVEVVSMYGFSTENWTRPKEEVDFIMDLFIRFFREWREEIKEKDIRVNHIGILEGLPVELQEEIKITEEATCHNKGTIFNIAINYGGRSEIVKATQEIYKKVQDNLIDINSIDEDIISNFIYTKGQPDLDILIRTGNEYRVSNFLLWQSAKAVIWSAPVLWPDFKRKHLWKAFEDFGKMKKCY